MSINLASVVPPGKLLYQNVTAIDTNVLSNFFVVIKMSLHICVTRVNHESPSCTFQHTKCQLYYSLKLRPHQKNGYHEKNIGMSLLIDVLRKKVKTLLYFRFYIICIEN